MTVPGRCGAVNPESVPMSSQGPDRVRETRPDYLLILPWGRKDEVMQQIAHIRDWDGQFVVPIPKVEVYP